LEFKSDLCQKVVYSQMLKIVYFTTKVYQAHFTHLILAKHES